MLTIIGAGITGLSAAYHYKDDFVIFEKEKRPGGLCRTEKRDGFLFDYTGHLIHYKEKWVGDLLNKLLLNNIISHERNSWIYSKNTYTLYPFQKNTYGLPPNVIKECLNGLIEAKSKKIHVRNFYDWIISNFGSGIAQHFMIPYNTKMWTVHPKEMSTHWIKDFVPNVSIQDFIDGSKPNNSNKIGYNSTFYYPKSGGIESVINAFFNNINSHKTKFEKELKKVNLLKKEITFNDNSIYGYEYLISTIPLPELVKSIDNLPKSIVEASNKLYHNSVYNINFGIDKEYISDKHWIYFPENNYPFYRIGFPTNFSKEMSPIDCTSIYTETSYSKNKPLMKNIRTNVVKSLINLGIISKESEIICEEILDIHYAYVIYDNEWKRNTSLILKFLEKNNIYSIGRYGEWKYAAMDDAIIDGKNIINKLQNNFMK